MKRISTLSLCLIVEVIGLSVLAVILYAFTVSDSRRLAETQSGLESAMRLNREATAGWNAAVAENIALKNKLSKEADAKTSVTESLKTLEWQFRDATKESMRVEGNLTEALNKTTAEADNLRTRLADEAVVKTAVLNEVKSLKAKVAEETAAKAAVIGRITGLESEVKRLNKELSISKSLSPKNVQKTEALITRIEDSFLAGHKINAGKTLKPVIFFPDDVMALTDIEKHKTALNRAVWVNQVWYQNQLGMTFAIADLAVFRGAKNTNWYESLSAEQRISAVYAEITGSNSLKSDGYVVFMYGINDFLNYGDWIHRVALINDAEIRMLLGEDGSILRYMAIAIVAHEIGHLWGLPHLVTNDKTAIMRVDTNGIVEAETVFPLATLSEQEKSILRNAIRKE